MFELPPDNDGTRNGQAARSVVAASAVGYVVFGLILVMVLNREPFSFVPRWYKRSGGARADRVRLALWYPGIVLLWPVALPLLALWRLGLWAYEVCARCVVAAEARRERRAEERPTSGPRREVEQV